MNVSDLKLKIFREIDSLEASRLEEFYGVMLNFVNGRKEDDEWIGLSETEITGIELLPNFTNNLIKQETTENGRARLVCDYLAGMTDAFALTNYKRLFDPDYSSIADIF